MIGQSCTTPCPSWAATIKELEGKLAECQHERVLDAKLLENVRGHWEHKYKELQGRLDKFKEMLGEVMAERDNALGRLDRIRSEFARLRFDPDFHLGLGDIRLTIAMQEDLAGDVEKQKPLCDECGKRHTPGIDHIWSE